jgi:hypothetical protein
MWVEEIHHKVPLEKLRFSKKNFRSPSPAQWVGMKQGSHVQTALPYLPAKLAWCGIHAAWAALVFSGGQSISSSGIGRGLGSKGVLVVDAESSKSGCKVVLPVRSTAIKGSATLLRLLPFRRTRGMLFGCRLFSSSGGMVVRSRARAGRMSGPRVRLRDIACCARSWTRCSIRRRSISSSSSEGISFPSGSSRAIQKGKCE